MGYKFQVKGWTNEDDSLWPEGVYHYKTLYDGNSLFKAIYTAARNYKRYGCVKVELR